MKYIHPTIIFLSLLFGLMLGATDALFDWMYHYQGKAPFYSFFFADLRGHEIVWRGSFLMMSLFFGLLFSYHYTRKSESQERLRNVFDSVIPICITNNDYDILEANKSYFKVFGLPKKTGKGVKCYDHRPGEKCRTEECPVRKISSRSAEIYTCESTKAETGKPTRTFIVTAAPYRDSKGRQIGIIESFQDITVRKELELEREKLIGKLNDALTKVKQLSGFIPICAKCKKVRDDKGFWSQVESYIAEHSEAEFSHSICPDCASKYYSKLSRK